MINCLEKKKLRSHSKVQQTTGTIYVTVDNVLDAITVNGNNVPLSGNVGDWTSLKTIQAKISPGDTISITGHNLGDVSGGNPAAIIASISYTDESGKTQTLNTDATWTCDGAPASTLGANGGSTIWKSVYGQIPTIDANAQWIWKSAAGTTATCSTKIPKKKNAQIDLYVDDILTGISVNGVAVTLPSTATAGWNVAKSVPANIKPGDIVAISGTNTGGPAGIIATITYIENGNTVTLNTGSAWTCDGKAATLQGNAKDTSTAWASIIPLTNVKDDAQWIWNPEFPLTTTCTIQIPRKQTNSQIDLTVDNIIYAITVNGQALGLPPKSDDWTVTKSIKAKIVPGDVVAITGKNTGGPAGIIASITYTDMYGTTAYLNTGSAWTCDGQAPKLQGNAKDTTTPWAATTLTNIQTDAQWIWNPSFPAQTTCTVQVPRLGKINVTVDNVLTFLTVNGNSVALPSGSDDWTNTKVINTNLGPGDVIAISGKNLGDVGSGNPAAILATITYPDLNGNLTYLDTDGKWTCDGKAALVLGNNGGNNIWTNVKGGPLANINSTASWIWSSAQTQTATCTITIPSGSCK